MILLLKYISTPSTAFGLCHSGSKTRLPSSLQIGLQLNLFQTFLLLLLYEMFVLPHFTRLDFWSFRPSCKGHISQRASLIICSNMSFFPFPFKYPVTPLFSSAHLPHYVLFLFVWLVIDYLF